MNEQLAAQPAVEVRPLAVGDRVLCTDDILYGGQALSQGDTATVTAIGDDRIELWLDGYRYHGGVRLSLRHHAACLRREGR